MDNLKKYEMSVKIYAGLDLVCTCDYGNCTIEECAEKAVESAQVLVKNGIGHIYITILANTMPIGNLSVSDVLGTRTDFYPDAIELAERYADVFLNAY